MGFICGCHSIVSYLVFAEFLGLNCGDEAELLVANLWCYSHGHMKRSLSMEVEWKSVEQLEIYCSKMKSKQNQIHGEYSRFKFNTRGIRIIRQWHVNT